MKMRRLIVLLGLLCLTAAVPARADADPAIIGHVKTLEGSAVAWRNGGETALEVGSPLFEGDRIRTGTAAGTALGMTLRDDTMLSLGADTEIGIDEFLFVPVDRQLGLAARITRGTMHFVSGIIGKLAPESVTVATPTGVIGLRGTRFVVRVAGE